jgi:hypothetical protein
MTKTTLIFMIPISYLPPGVASSQEYQMTSPSALLLILSLLESQDVSLNQNIPYKLLAAEHHL